MPGMKKTMQEYGQGKLRSGSKSGPVVSNRKQAIAIGLSEQRAGGHPHRNLGKYLHKKKGR